MITRSRCIMQLAMLATSVISGCASNQVSPLSTVQNPQPGRSTIVFGMGVENTQGYANSMYSIRFDQYDPQSHTAGNCSNWNTINAEVPVQQSGIAYRSFAVPPGLYTFSRFNTAAQMDEHQTQRDMVTAFEVPAGHIVYIGDFVLKGRQIEYIPQPVDHLPSSVMQDVPSASIEIASTEAVPIPPGFMCTP